MKYTFLLLIMFCYQQPFAQNNPYNRVFDHYRAEKHFNGAALTATSGKIDFLNGAGIANRQTGTTINSKSRFRIASITKTFTAVIIMQLQQEHKINLGDMLGKYLPSYKGPAKNKVSIYNLLTYSSGLPNCEHNRNMEVYQLPLSVDAFIDQYSSGVLEFEPGTKFSYDNGDYIILGRIIERITGRSFQQNLSERILQPLHMQNTGLLRSGDIIPGLVSSYIFNDSTKGFENDPPYLIENFNAAGAMYSTVEDLLKFDQGIFNYQLVTKASVEQMIKPDTALGNAGLGFWYSKDYAAIDEPYVYRPGGIQGSAANWIHILDSNKTIIAFANTDATNLFELSQQLYKVSKGKAPDSFIKEVTAKEPSKNLDSISGIYLLDLRPGPNSAPYLKDLSLIHMEEKNFSGEFYGSTFTDGYFNTYWDKIFFAFTTGDKENTYYHSGYIEGNNIFGISFAPQRKFSSHWTGDEKALSNIICYIIPYTAAKMPAWGRSALNV